MQFYAIIILLTLDEIFVAIVTIKSQLFAILVISITCEASFIIKTNY